MSWIKRGWNNLSERWKKIGRLEEETDKRTLDEEVSRADISQWIDDPAVRVIQTYIPYREVVISDRSAKRYRDPYSGQFMGVAVAKIKMKEVQGFNFEQKILSVNPKMGQADMDYFWGRYGMLRDIDTDDANEYVRDILSP